MLMDFGTGLYPGAAPLTPPMGFPGTPALPLSRVLALRVPLPQDPTERYRPLPRMISMRWASPSCRLLSGDYPEPAVPSRDEHGTLHLDSVLLPPALAEYPHVDPVLRALTLRLLSVNPEQRGTAAQLAKELEATLKPFRPRRSSLRQVWTRAPWRYGWLGGTVAAAALAWCLGAWWALPGRPHPEPSRTGSARAGTAGLGDAENASESGKAPVATPEAALGGEALPKPIPGQVRTDEKGRCPLKGLVSLNGGCWTETSAGDTEKCLELGGELFKGVCYLPFIPPGRKRPPTSDSGEGP